MDQDEGTYIVTYTMPRAGKFKVTRVLTLTLTLTLTLSRTLTSIQV